LPKIRLEIACNDEFVDVAIEAILRSAKHGEGQIGDGKIFVTELKRCIRIRTEESGSTAI
ncbi:MAG: transcriptional regulator, partial [Xanthomonadaceae bacterium]|nr:transcriptional regulator [Xanthomonadaceae bacterium]